LQVARENDVYFLEVVWLAIGLSMDALAVSLCAGASGYAHERGARFRLAFSFGFFQAAMPILGWLVGLSVAQLISSIDHWVAFGLLALVGFHMIRSGLFPSSDSDTCDPTRGRTLLMLSVATSIDALAVGFSMALLGMAIWWPALVIGLITFSISYLAAMLGGKLNSTLGKRMEILGGVVLLAIGVRILLSHLLG
jgi:manganese efflux pump family protein